MNVQTLPNEPSKSKDRTFHRRYDDLLRGTKFEGWTWRDETAVDPDGHVYTKADDEYWELTNFMNDKLGVNADKK